MGKTKKIIESHDLEEILENLVLKRIIFSPTPGLDFWKSAYDALMGVFQVIEIKLTHWKKATNFKEIGGQILLRLKETTVKFAKKIRKEGCSRGLNWNGCSEECAELIETYQKECQPILLELSKKLEPESYIRTKIETQLKSQMQVY